MKREGGRESSVLAWFLGGVAAIVDSHAHTHTEREEEYIVKGSDWPAGHRALDCRDERSQSNILLFFLSVYEQKQFCGCLGRFSAAANGIKAKCRFLLKYNFRREIQKQKKSPCVFRLGFGRKKQQKKTKKWEEPEPNRVGRCNRPDEDVTDGPKSDSACPSRRVIIMAAGRRRR